jgi:hypothetical protein
MAPRVVTRGSIRLSAVTPPLLGDRDKASLLAQMSFYAFEEVSDYGSIESVVFGVFLWVKVGENLSNL